VTLTFRVRQTLGRLRRRTWRIALVTTGTTSVRTQPKLFRTTPSKLHDVSSRFIIEAI
jgi:hypothetical protein